MSVSKEHRERGRRWIATCRRALAGHPDAPGDANDEPDIEPTQWLPFRDDD